MLMRFDPFHEREALSEQLRDGRRGRLMALDASRAGVLLHVDLDLPGVKPESIEVAVEKNVLTVKAERTWKTEGLETIVCDARLVRSPGNSSSLKAWIPKRSLRPTKTVWFGSRYRSPSRPRLAISRCTPRRGGKRLTRRMWPEPILLAAAVPQVISPLARSSCAPHSAEGRHYWATPDGRSR